MKIKEYTLQEPPFKGGMALVYKGQNPSGFTRAFKLVRPDKAANSARLCQQFLQEIKLQSRLDHPNIIKILDAFTHSDLTGKSCTVLEMEWLNGMDLQRYIDEKAKKGLDEATIKKILLQILDGLEYAHKNNILHLDIKPSNLFRTFDGHIKIIDFGIARVVGDNAQIIEGAEKLTKVTETGESTFKGTLAFSSPEQQVGGKLGYYSDIYSLGKTLHFLSTGSTDPSVEVKSSKIAYLVEHCTYDNPKKRFQSCSELRKAIEEEEVSTKKCCNCKKEISATAMFCQFCGASQAQAPKPEPIKCPKCGKVHSGKPTFCDNCGHTLVQIKYKCNNCQRTWIDQYNDGKTHCCQFCGSDKIVRTS